MPTGKSVLRSGSPWKKSLFFLAVLAGLLALVQFAQAAPGMFPAVAASAQAVKARFVPFGFLWSSHFAPYERVMIFAVLAVAICSILYAWMLMRMVKRADRGTAKMQEVSQAIREGSIAYLGRQVLADLDATGNTTKAVTKGIAIGSAVVAAVSLFAAFITVIGTGGGSAQSHLTSAVYNAVTGLLSVSNPRLFVGMLIGGAVPFLFSSMTIRAVGRAAFLIVKECRLQFRDPKIWSGEKNPDYGQVVNICTVEAQRELIGPGLLAVLSPVLVGFLLGVSALAGFLAGAIVSGQLMAVFMINSGGAWDNAKKIIEDEPRDAERNSGKGSERHKAAVTGDTVGDPLKDTAGPAINPLIKVMNMVSLLAIPLILPFDPGFINALSARISTASPVMLSHHTWIPWVIAAGCLLALGWAVYNSKRESAQMKRVLEGLAATGGEVPAAPSPDAGK